MLDDSMSVNEVEDEGEHRELLDWQVSLEEWIMSQAPGCAAVESAPVIILVQVAGALDAWAGAAMGGTLCGQYSILHSIGHCG